jgi:adenylosuccinate lyase
MIARYTHPVMGAIWSERRRYEAWLEVELAATEALVAAGETRSAFRYSARSPTTTRP